MNNRFDDTDPQQPLYDFDTAARLVFTIEKLLPGGFYACLLDHAIAEINVISRRLVNVSYGRFGGRDDRLIWRMELALTSWSSLTAAVLQLGRIVDVTGLHHDWTSGKNALIPPQCIEMGKTSPLDSVDAHRVLAVLGKWANLGTPFVGDVRESRFTIAEHVDL